MNKWKIAFWICLLLLVIVSSFCVYSIVDQGVSLTYMREGYTDTENDLNNLSKIITETNLSKQQIRNTLKQHHLYEYMDFNTDTVSMDRINLVFKNDTLYEITNQW